MSFNISELRGKGEVGRGEDVGEAGQEEGGGDVGEDTGGVEGSDEEEEETVESELQEGFAVECFTLTWNMFLTFSSCFCFLNFLAAALRAAFNFLNFASFVLLGSDNEPNLIPPM